MGNSYDIQLPNITAETLKGELDQLKSYLYQTVGTLNWALNTIVSDSREVVQSELQKVSEESASPEKAQATFDEIKALIIKSADIVEAYEQKMKVTFDDEYAAQSDYGAFKQNATATLEAHGSDINAHSTAIQSLDTATSGLQTRMTDAEFDINGLEGAVSAKVSVTENNTTKAASWSLTPDNGMVITAHQTAKDAFAVYVGNTKVLSVNLNGLHISGDGTFSGTISGSTISGSTLTSVNGSDSVTIGSGKVVCTNSQNYNTTTIANGYVKIDNDDSNQQAILSPNTISLRDNDGSNQIVVQTGPTNNFVNTTGATRFQIPQVEFVGIGMSTDKGSGSPKQIQIGRNNHTYTDMYGETTFHDSVYASADIQANGDIEAGNNLYASNVIYEGGMALANKYEAKSNIACGSGTINSNTFTHINFGKTFASIPKVVATYVQSNWPSGQIGSIKINNLSTSGFDATVSGSWSGDVGINWMAMV